MIFFRAVFLLFLTSSVFSADAITISRVIGKSAETLFYNQDFETFNQWDDEYRASQQRLPDGRWQLTFLYSNLGRVSSKGSEEEWRQKLDLVNQWIKKTPDHPAPYLAKAEILRAYAWNLRRSGGSILKKRRLFQERIAEARAVLDGSSPLTSEHPYGLLQMEIIAKEQGWPAEDFNQLYELASEKYPTYYFLHFRAADYYLPHWHGSKKALRAFVDQAVEKSKSKEGLTLYTRIYWSQLWALQDKTFAKGNAEWPKMKQGFEDIMKDYPDSLWNLNAFAFYACMAKDPETTRTLIEKIGNDPHLSIWSSMSTYYACKSYGEKSS